MNKKSAIGFAQWLKLAHPDIFTSILRQAEPVATQGKTTLSDWSDVLSSVGDAASSAVSAVGNFVSNPQNISSLSNVAVAYFKSQSPNPVIANAQGAVFATQLQRAQAGLSPAPIVYNQGLPVYTQGGSQYPLTPTGLAGYRPTFLQQYGLILGVGGGALLLLVLLSR